MTPQELAEFREIAGLNSPSATEINKEWADNQLTNQPKLENQAPLPTIQNQIFDNKSSEDRELENLATRLNGLLGSNDFKVERLK